MISYNTRNRIREKFSQFNKTTSSPVKPKNSSSNKDTKDDSSDVIYMDSDFPEKNIITPMKLNEMVTEKPLTVNYSGEKLLDKTLNISSKKIGVVSVCVYKICNSDTNPYLLFSLFRKNNEYNFYDYDMRKK